MFNRLERPVTDLEDHSAQIGRRLYHVGEELYYFRDEDWVDIILDIDTLHHSSITELLKITESFDVNKFTEEQRAQLNTFLKNEDKSFTSHRLMLEALVNRDEGILKEYVNTEEKDFEIRAKEYYDIINSDAVDPSIKSKVKYEKGKRFGLHRMALWIKHVPSPDPKVIEEYLEKYEIENYQERVESALASLRPHNSNDISE